MTMKGLPAPSVGTPGTPAALTVMVMDVGTPEVMEPTWAAWCRLRGGARARRVSRDTRARGEESDTSRRRDGDASQAAQHPNKL